MHSGLDWVGSVLAPTGQAIEATWERLPFPLLRVLRGNDHRRLDRYRRLKTGPVSEWILKTSQVKPSFSEPPPPSAQAVGRHRRHAYRPPRAFVREPAFLSPQASSEPPH